MTEHSQCFEKAIIKCLNQGEPIQRLKAGLESPVVGLKSYIKLCEKSCDVRLDEMFLYIFVEKLLIHTVVYPAMFYLQYVWLCMLAALWVVGWVIICTSFRTAAGEPLQKWRLAGICKPCMPARHWLGQLAFCCCRSYSSLYATTQCTWPIQLLN